MDRLLRQTPQPHHALCWWSYLHRRAAPAVHPRMRSLQKLNGKRTDAGQLIVGISEHVTYWNQLGWSDPFSQFVFTERQNAYGGRFHLDSVYTPQIVVNGEKPACG